jgi:hypothetical protein
MRELPDAQEHAADSKLVPLQAPMATPRSPNRGGCGGCGLCLEKPQTTPVSKSGSLKW